MGVMSTLDDTTNRHGKSDPWDMGMRLFTFSDLIGHGPESESVVEGGGEGFRVSPHTVVVSPIQFPPKSSFFMFHLKQTILRMGLFAPRMPQD